MKCQLSDVVCNIATNVWIGATTVGEVSEIKYNHFVNFDDTAFDLNAVLECLGEATQYWSIRMADENSIEL